MTFNTTGKPALIILLCLIWICIAGALFAQDTQDNQNNQREAAGSSYQIPQTIYIGDRARLVRNLDMSFFDTGDRVIPPGDPQEDDDIVIHNIEIKNGRLIIDFQAFRTGIISLPPVLIGGLEISGLEVKVSSLIESGNPAALSPFERPLNVPGTLWIIVLATVIIIAAITVVLILFFYGGRFFLNLRGGIRQQYIMLTTMRFIKKLRLSVKKENTAPQTALGEITTMLRIFLDRYFGLNCRSMVPSEFLAVTLPPGRKAQDKYTPEYFFNFFTRCDTMRFSGQDVSMETVRGIIDEVEAFVKAQK